MGAWDGAEPASAAHPYIVRKLGLPDGLRVYRGSLTVAGQALDGALLVPAFSAEGSLATWQAIPAEAGAQKLNAPGRPMAGTFTVGGPVRAGEPVFICEGIGAAWSAHQANAKPAVVAFGSLRLQQAAQSLLERFPGCLPIVAADIGQEAHCEAVAAAVGGLWVGMPAGWPANSDVNDLHQRDGLGAVAALLAAPQKPAPEVLSAAELSVDDELPEPSDLFAAAMPSPFPVRESMPSVLADWVEMQVAATGLDAAGFAVAPLAVLSGASDRSVRVRLGPTHLSSCVIWAAILGETGTGKSPAMDLAIAPLKQIDADLGRDFASAMRAHEANPKSEPKPVRQMHVLSDATIEAVGRKLHESDGHRVVRHVDEGSGWLNAMGRYAAAGKSDGERGLYLTGWVGPHDHVIARIERGDLLVPEMGVAMLFGITPGKVREGYAEASEEGLLARCLAVLLDRGKHVAPDRSVAPGRAESAYASVVRRVARAKGEIVLSDESQGAFDGFRSECRDLCDAISAVSPGLSAMLAKLPENTGRIAALYSLCADRVDGRVHIEQMTQAIAMARALLAHAKVLYRTVLAVDSATALQRDLAERILRQNATRIARRDLRTAKWESADEPTRRAAIDMLGADRWLLAEDSQRVRAGSRFSEATAWHVNSKALDGRFDAVRVESVQKAERALAALAKL
jgi:hypothetical protein